MGKLQVRISIVLMLMLACFAVVQISRQLTIERPRHPNWGMVPYHLGKWQGDELPPDPIFGASDPADSSMIRAYRTAGDSAPIIVYAGFHNDLPTSLDYHTPDLCYPAQGWGILSESRCRVGKFRGRWVQANEIKVDRYGERRLVIWWYHAGPDPFEKRIRQVGRLLFMSMFTGRRDGSIVRVETTIGADSEASAQERLLGFSSFFLPSLETALPQ